MSHEGIACAEPPTFGDFGVCNDRGFTVCDLAIRDFELRMVLPDAIQNSYRFAKRKRNEQMDRFSIR